jgi:hypothetical protein
MAILALMHILRTGSSQEWRHRGGSEVDEDQRGLWAQGLNRTEADGIQLISGCLKEIVGPGRLPG